MDALELFAGESIDIELNDKTNDEYIRNNNIDKSNNNNENFSSKFFNNNVNDISKHNTTVYDVTENERLAGEQGSKDNENVEYDDAQLKEDLLDDLAGKHGSDVYETDSFESKYVDQQTEVETQVRYRESDKNVDKNVNSKDDNNSQLFKEKMFVSLDTMSPSIRFYSHVRVSSVLDHEVMLLAKGPDNYPWSKHFRQAVLVQHKTPIPPYFNQLPSGERPDTLIVHSIPAIWFLDEDDDDVEEELDDRLYNFTQRGATILEAAFLRFGSVKAVDLLFEMVNRDQEDSLTFDAYIQFRKFDGFSKAFYALNKAIMYDDRNPKSQALCISKFDTSGYFCRQNRRLRAARRDLAKQEREQSEKAAKVKAYRKHRAMKDKYNTLMKEFKKCQDRFDAVNENANPIGYLKSVKHGLKEAMTAMHIANKLHELADNYNAFGKAIKQLKLLLTNVERIVDKEVAISKLRVPTIFEALEDHHAYTFSDIIRLKLNSNPKYFNGCTIFVPPDHAFLDEYTDTWEEECWGTHIIKGPYHMQDLYILGNCGPGTMLCANMAFSLNCRLNEAGEYIVWLTKRKQPRRVVRVIASDVRVEGGSILHFIDKIIYPD